MEELFDRARGGNPFSQLFLSHARLGWFTERQKEFVFALCWRGKREIDGTFLRLLSVGGTSGADWSAGWGLGMEESLSKDEREA